MKKININCKTCNKEFLFRNKDKRDKNKFCSSVCALSDVRTIEHQKNAGKKGAIVNILKYRGTGLKSYVKENGRHQHRVVIEKILNRKLTSDEIVHHKDHNKKNNDPSNLQIMTRAEHAREHFKKHK